jgi:hypothetical protein
MYFTDKRTLIVGLFLWTAVTSGLCFGQNGMGEGLLEPYSVRPNIEEIEGATSPESALLMWNLQKAHLNWIAQMIELYDDGEKHFCLLMRDVEFLGDDFRMAVRGTPLASRVHILNISRINVADKNLKKYLEQNGITERRARNGHILFIDSGYDGNLLEKIKSHFSPEGASGIQAHFFLSRNSKIPSSHGTVRWLTAAMEAVSDGRNVILDYEHTLPRYTDRSIQFSLIDEIWQPMSLKAGGNAEEKVNKDRTLTFLRQAKFNWQIATPESLDSFFERKRLSWRTLIRLFKESQSIVAQKFLKGYLDELSRVGKNPAVPMMIADILHAAQVNKVFPHAFTAPEKLFNFSPKPLPMKDLDLDFKLESDSFWSGNKAGILAWVKNYLIQIQNEPPKTYKEIDPEFRNNLRSLLKILGEGPPPSKALDRNYKRWDDLRKDLVNSLFLLESPTVNLIFLETLNNGFLDYGNLWIDAVVERKNPALWKTFAQYFTSIQNEQAETRPGTLGYTLLTKMMKAGTPDLFGPDFFKDTFKLYYHPALEESVLLDMIDRSSVAEVNGLVDAIEYIPLLEFMPTVLERLILKADFPTLERVVKIRYLFKKSSFAQRVRLIKAMSIRDPEARRAYFNPPERSSVNVLCQNQFGS